MTLRWYAAQTKPRLEIQALMELGKQNFHAFLPTVTRKTTRRCATSHRKKAVEVQEALYPSYVFVEFDAERDQWWAINSTRGIRRLIVYESERPKPIPDGAIDWLIKQSRSGGFEDLAGYGVRRAFETGSKLKIISGPYENQTITCIEDAVDTVRGFIACFGGEIMVTVPVGLIDAA